MVAVAELREFVLQSFTWGTHVPEGATALAMFALAIFASIHLFGLRFRLVCVWEITVHVYFVFLELLSMPI